MNIKEMKMVSGLITSMLKIKKQDHDEGVLTVFGMTIEDYPFQDVMVALKKINNEGVKYMLEPHHIIEAMGPSESELSTEAHEEWHHYLSALASPSPKFENPVTAFLAQSIVSIWALKSTGTDRDVQASEKKFLKAYVDAKRSRVEQENITQKCLRGEAPMLYRSSLDRLEQEENLRLGLGDDGKELGESK